jgi:putative hydrolase of the HAD superfamily
VKIRAITVDFWGTLLHDGPRSDDRYKRRRMEEFARILRAQGVRTSASSLSRAYDASAPVLADLWRRNRDLSGDGHVQAILDGLDPALAGGLSAAVRAELLEAYASPALEVPPSVDEGARLALETLRARGYALALVSNTMRTPGFGLRRLLQRFGLLGCFQHTTFSDELGIRKPDPEIFWHTLRAVGAAAEESVHVGDDPVLDVHGARQAGLRVIQVTTVSLASLGPAGPDDAIAGMAGLPEAVSRLET